jgi:hypothetical protein
VNYRIKLLQPATGNEAIGEAAGWGLYTQAGTNMCTSFETVVAQPFTGNSENVTLTTYPFGSVGDEVTGLRYVFNKSGRYRCSVYFSNGAVLVNSPNLNWVLGVGVSNTPSATTLYMAVSSTEMESYVGGTSYTFLTTYVCDVVVGASQHAFLYLSAGGQIILPATQAACTIIATAEQIAVLTPYVASLELRDLERYVEKLSKKSTTFRALLDRKRGFLGESEAATLKLVETSDEKDDGKEDEKAASKKENASKSITTRAFVEEVEEPPRVSSTSSSRSSYVTVDGETGSQRSLNLSVATGVKKTR